MEEKQTLRDVVGNIWLSRELLQDFEDICDCGGRVAGTESESKAQDLLYEKLSHLGGELKTHTFSVVGRESVRHRVKLTSNNFNLDSYPLLNCQDTGGEQTVEVIDLGRGTRVDFEGARERIAGKAVLVRHEFPFSTNHVHRGVKYAMAQEFGASAFLIGNNQPGAGPVSGSGGTGEDTDIPAFGLSYNATTRLSTQLTYGPVEVTIHNEAVEKSWTGRNLFVHFPGQTNEHVVLSAHIDGHGLAESAMDNGAGLATVLEVARQVGPSAHKMKRGLTLALFTFEEWALTGSARYVEELTQEDKDNIFCNVNVDTPVGYPRVFGLTAGNERILQLLKQATRSGGTPIHPIYAHTSNSDHFNFLQAGIPAVRLIGGYNDETATSRLLLTAADHREVVEPLDLRHGAMTTAAVVLASLE